MRRCPGRPRMTPCPRGGTPGGTNNARRAAPRWLVPTLKTTRSGSWSNRRYRQRCAVSAAPCRARPVQFLPPAPSFTLDSDDVEDGQPFGREFVHCSVGGDNLSPPVALGYSEQRARKLTSRSWSR